MTPDTPGLTAEKIAELRRLCEEVNGPHFHDARTRLEFNDAARKWLPRLLDLVTPPPDEAQDGIGLETTASEIKARKELRRVDEELCDCLECRLLRDHARLTAALNHATEREAKWKRACKAWEAESLETNAREAKAREEERERIAKRFDEEAAKQRVEMERLQREENTDAVGLLKWKAAGTKEANFQHWAAAIRSQP